MGPFDFEPHWNQAGTRLLLVLLGVLLGMTALAVGLRRRARTEAGRRFARDFGARTLGWWLLIAVYMPAVLAGGGALLALYAVVMVTAWYEFTGLTPLTALRPRDLLWTAPLVGLHLLVLAGRLPGPGWWPAAVGGVTVMLASAGPGWSARSLWRFAGFVYCVLIIGLGPWIAMRFGLEYLVFISVVVPTGDVCQYLAGKLWGRRLLAPALSPKKTWEGLLGGSAAAVVLGAALAPVIGASRPVGLLWGGVLSLAGTGGGLLMSAAKRRWQAKDFSGVVPGQGGVLDRFDSFGAAFVAAVGLLCAGFGGQ